MCRAQEKSFMQQLRPWDSSYDRMACMLIADLLFGLMALVGPKQATYPGGSTIDWAPRAAITCIFNVR